MLGPLINSACSFSDLRSVLLLRQTKRKFCPPRTLSSLSLSLCFEFVDSVQITRLVVIDRWLVSSIQSCRSPGSQFLDFPILFSFPKFFSSFLLFFVLISSSASPLPVQGQKLAVEFHTVEAQLEFFSSNFIFSSVLFPLSLFVLA